MIPKYLYRGDSDRPNKKLLRQTINHYQIESNLIRGGIGEEIFKSPLKELINKHVITGWDFSHFLSFSTSKETALRYGLNLNENTTTDIEDHYQEHYEDNENWDFVIIKLDTDKIKKAKIGKGIYLGYYSSSLLKYQNSDCRILLINVVDAISGVKYSEAIRNAVKDYEWLVLPANPTEFNNKLEYSAILDVGNIAEIQKYKSI